MLKIPNFVVREHYKQREMDVLSEITPLAKDDCIYVIERSKDSFDFPLHCHQAIELNFLEHADGARRIVGDNAEDIGSLDLTLIGSNLIHAWQQHHCDMDGVHEITVQIPSDLLSEDLLSRNDFSSIAHLLRRAQNGISFGPETIRRVRDNLYMLARMAPGFHRFLKVLSILYDLSVSQDCRTLASGAFTRNGQDSDNARVAKVCDYIERNYRHEIRLADLALIADLTETSFSRFFSMHAGRSISDYILSVRIGHAVRLLLNTSMDIAEVCYDCGFNTVSHFNRCFKARKGCSPTQFRKSYARPSGH